jgi:cell division control protein 6
MEEVFERSTNSGRSVFRSEADLAASHTPEKPVERDHVIEQIADALRPLARHKTPRNLLVYGPAGTGKTTCVRHVLNRLEDETRVKPIYINCWQYNTWPSLLTQLLIELGYPAPRKGKPVDERLSKLREWLDKNRSVAIVLDEFDQLTEKTEAVYDLQLLNQEAENDLAIVMMSNQHPTRLRLDPRSQSRLNCQTLGFPSYDTDQLTEILEQRVEQAFRPGTVTDEAIETIAKTVAENSGDCRKALESLLQAGRKADQEGKSEVAAATVAEHAEG